MADITEYIDTADRVLEMLFRSDYMLGLCIRKIDNTVQPEILPGIIFGG